MAEKGGQERIILNYAEAHYNMGNAKYMLGDYKGAVKDWEKAIELNPDWENSLRLKIAKARKKIKSGKEQESENVEKRAAEYDTTVWLSPDLPGAYYSRGNAKYQIADYSGAVGDYDKAVKLNPNYAQAYGNRGAAKYKLNDYKGAIEDWGKAIQLDSSLNDKLQPNIDKARTKIK